MERCAYCQGPLDQSGRFCRTCGQLQPARAASAPAQPMGATRPLEMFCSFCGGEIAPDALYCIFCARPVRRGPMLAWGRQTRPLALCRFCGEELLQGARFCVTCAQPVVLSDPAAPASGQGVSGSTGPLPVVGAAGALAAGGIGAQMIPGMGYSGPVPAFMGPASIPGMGYSGPVPAVQPLSAGAQIGQASIPTAYAAPQMGNASLPTIPAGAQTGASSAPGAVAQAAVKGAARGIGGKLLATTQAKVLAIILVTVLAVPTGAAVVVAARGGNPLSIFTPSTPTISATATATFTPLPTATPNATTFVRFTQHTKQVNIVAWSPDGSLIASGSDDQTILIWNAATGQVLHTLHHLPDDINAISWSPDGRRIAAASDDIAVWDVNSGSLLFTYTGHVLSGTEPLDDVNTVAWSPNGSYIASGGDDHTVQVWDANNGTPLLVYPVSNSVSLVAWSPDSTRIAAALGTTDNKGENTVHVFDARSGATQYVSSDHTKALWAVGWSPNGQRIAVGGSNGVVEVWDASTGNNFFTYQGHGGASVYTLAWNADSQRIASGSRDGTVQIWDDFTGTLLTVYREHNAPVYSVAWQPGGAQLASGDKDGTIFVWAPR
jgi:WD40 repeat protein